MEITVKGMMDELKASQGFVIFTAFTQKNEKGDMEIQFRYLRQTFAPDDLEKTFEGVRGAISGDLKQSGMNMIKTAENIANQNLPGTEAAQ